LLEGINELVEYKEYINLVALVVTRKCEVKLIINGVLKDCKP